MKGPKTPRNLKEILLGLNYYNIVNKLITINQTRPSRSAGRALKTDEGKYNLRSTERITGHYITVQTVLTIHFWFD